MNIEKTNQRKIMYREALNEALREEMRKDPAVFLLGEGIAERGWFIQSDGWTPARVRVETDHGHTYC